MTKTMKNINVTINNTKAARAEGIVNTTPELGGRRIAVVSTDLFDVDYSYQRVRTSHVNYISDNFDINECDPLLVSYRDGKFYIIDGQHRYFAALTNGIKNLLCIIRTGLTKEDEARIFARINTSRKPLTPYDVYKANIANGNEAIPEVRVDMIIKRICDKYNVKVRRDTTHASPRMIRTIPGIRKYISPNPKKGEHFFDWFLKTITNSEWRDEHEAYRSCFITCFHSYYADNLTDLDNATQKLTVMMSKHSPIKVMGYAKVHYSNYGTVAGISNAIRELV